MTRSPRLGDRCRFRLDQHWDQCDEDVTEAHDGMECRVLRPMTDDIYPKNGFFMVVFDDGFIFLAGANELELLEE